MRNAIRIVGGFFCGIVTQTLMTVVATRMYANKPILWAFAASWLIVAALLVGISIVGREAKEAKERAMAKRREGMVQ